MKIRNRIADIKILQAHILQDYFRMALVASFIDDAWKPIFQCEVEKSVNSQYSRSYIGAWEKMQLKGLDDYSIADMDTTIITAILKGPFDGSFGCCKFKKINQYLEYLQEDRNIDAHTTGNETDSELLQWLYGSLHNISRFISAVSSAKESNVPGEERTAYARKYQTEIESLRLLFENDYKEAFEAEEIDKNINSDVERIKNSKDPLKTYIEIERQYFNKRDNEGKLNIPLYNRFMHIAADAGIVCACSWLGDMYFDGIMVAVDYIKAAEYYEKGFSKLTPPQKLNLANIYINGLCNSFHSKEDVMAIIKSCESHRWKIVTYTSKDGYEFFSIERTKLVTDKSSNL